LNSVAVINKTEKSADFDFQIAEVFLTREKWIFCVRNCIFTFCSDPSQQFQRVIYTKLDQKTANWQH